MLLNSASAILFSLSPPSAPELHQDGRCNNKQVSTTRYHSFLKMTAAVHLQLADNQTFNEVFVRFLFFCVGMMMMIVIIKKAEDDGNFVPEYPGNGRSRGRFEAKCDTERVPVYIHNK